MNYRLRAQSNNNDTKNTVQKLDSINAQTWLKFGSLAELMSDYDKAITCYEAALRYDPYSGTALKQIASLYRTREQFEKAIEYFKHATAIEKDDGTTWASLGHCYLMTDNLPEAYEAYQQALHYLSNPKDPKLWYGIGILYDRYGSLDHAEEAFTAVMRMDQGFEKANEVYFRLGIIYKQQRKLEPSLQCFNYVLNNPPQPLNQSDIWFQIGHVYEQMKKFEAAKNAYETVLSENPDHAKVLQQLGWIYHQPESSFCNQQLANDFLTRSLKADGTDPQSWYLLGRCYMAEKNYNKAYESYQQAVYRDARNPTFWCSIGVLYYQINQYRDALDAYSRAIRLNPNISEVWYDLGTLYESCHNQIQDAMDAYQRAAELDPQNTMIQQRLDLLKKPHQRTESATAALEPRDVSNPSQYINQAAGSSSMLPYDERSRKQIKIEHTVSEQRFTEPGRNLPDLPTEATLSEKKVHIPDINGRKMSLSPSFNNATMMNPMQLHANDTKEPTKSPQPSAFGSNTRNEAIDIEDEEMIEANALDSKTNIPAMQAEDDEKMTEKEA